LGLTMGFGLGLGLGLGLGFGLILGLTGRDLGFSFFSVTNVACTAFMGSTTESGFARSVQSFVKTKNNPKCMATVIKTGSQ